MSYIWIKLPTIELHAMRKSIFIVLAAILSSCAASKKITPSLSALPLQKLNRNATEQDFDLLVKALKEAHTGLYWYSSPEKFDSIVAVQRSKISDSLNIFEFYNITAPIVAFTKEDHCDISLPATATKYLMSQGKFLPLEVVSLNEKIYVLNDPDEKTRICGQELLEINGIHVKDIYNHIFGTFAADGFVKSSKFRYLDNHGLAREYAKTIGQPEYFELVTLNTDKSKEHHRVNACAFSAFKPIFEDLRKKGIIREATVPAKFEFETTTAILTINTFSNSSYEEANMDFEIFIKNAFDSIMVKNPKALIIDIRENGGGSEGNEDYLFSYLTNKLYNKYRYVEASGFTYSFLEYTDYSKPEDREDLESDLREEHFLADDGRILRKPDINPVAPLKPNPYNGMVYVLTSGWTYSGGAEFASLMREHTKAILSVKKSAVATKAIPAVIA